MDNKIKVDVKLEKDEMAKFLIRHTYSRFGGIFGIILSVAALVVVIVFWAKLITMQRVMMILLALLFTVIQPALLWFKGIKQLKQPAFKKPFSYEFGNQISVSQGSQGQTFQWTQIRKVITTKEAIYVYMSATSAFIIPKRCCETDYVALAKLMKDKTKK